MKHELDLRKKIEPRIIERVVFKRRPWHTEALKLALAILVATGSVYAISKADELASTVSASNPTQSFSVIGFVSEITGGTVSIEGANGSDGRKNASYSFGLATISKIETSEYLAMPASLIRVGDQVIVQGTQTDGVVTPTRIISFAQISAEEIAAAQAVVSFMAGTPSTVASDVSTSTPDVSAGASIAAIASTTPSEGVTADADVVFSSTTPHSIVAEATSTSTGAVATSTVASTEEVSTSTPTSTEEVATSTVATSTVVSTEPFATSTDSSAVPVDPVVPQVTAPAPVQPEVVAPVTASDAQVPEPPVESSPVSAE